MFLNWASTQSDVNKMLKISSRHKTNGCHKTDIESSWEYQKVLLHAVEHQASKQNRTLFKHYTTQNMHKGRHEKTDWSPPLLPQIAILDPSERKHFKKKGNVDFSGWGTAAFRAYCAITAFPYSQNRTKLKLKFKLPFYNTYIPHYTTQK